LLVRVSSASLKFELEGRGNDAVFERGSSLAARNAALHENEAIQEEDELARGPSQQILSDSKGLEDIKRRMSFLRMLPSKCLSDSQRPILSFLACVPTTASLCLFNLQRIRSLARQAATTIMIVYH